MNLTLNLRRQKFGRDAGGYNRWQIETARKTVAAAKTALILCDVWDTHTCRGAIERLERMLPRMNEVVKVVRAAGGLIVHAPSDTMDFYQDSPARRRVLDAPPAEVPPDRELDDPPLPIDDQEACDTERATSEKRPWTRQNAAIEIDQERDVISDQGRELHGVYEQRGMEQLLILGVHTNMCVLRRTFAIKQMVRWGYEIALIRDLTDTMYNPARPPYVSHEEGTALVIAYIEKFWCPTIESQDLLAGR
jgi:nicotinamidase-related amidase